MSWAYGPLGVLLLGLLGVAFCYWPLRLDVSGRARGEPDGRWLVAGGASLSALSLAFVWAKGMPPQLTFLLFGRKLSWRPKLRKKAEPGAPRPKKSMPAWMRRVDPLDFALKALEERRHFRLRYLVVELAYGFRDPLLTGRLVGAIAALSAVLPSRVEVRQSPRWDFEDGWEIALDGRAFVKPWLMLLDLSTYVVRQVASRRAAQAEPSSSPGSSHVR